MLRRELNIPPAVAKAFVRDMKAFFKTSGPEADEIAARQCWALQAFQGPREKKLRLADVKQMFHALQERV